MDGAGAAGSAPAAPAVRGLNESQAEAVLADPAQPLCISLPPVSQWFPESGLENKLPDAYWAKFAPTPHCVLRQPNAQISLSSL